MKPLPNHSLAKGSGIILTSMQLGLVAATIGAPFLHSSLGVANATGILALLVCLVAIISALPRTSNVCSNES